MIKDMILKCRCYRRFDSFYEIGEDILRSIVYSLRYISSAKNAQPLKYIVSKNEQKNKEIFSTLRWAGYLSDWDGPRIDERPKAYLIILQDTTISNDNYALTDAGIAIQTVMLSLTELNLGGCTIAAIDRDRLSRILRLENHLTILYVIAIGKPKENVIITDVKDGSIKYYRDKENNHYVPKRSVNELILKFFT